MRNSKNEKSLSLNNKRFGALENKVGLSSSNTIFHYFETEMVITGTYNGGAIKEGFIVGKRIDQSRLELLYQCITTNGELRAGKSKGIITETVNGSLKLDFEWNWLNGDLSGGRSSYIEIEDYRRKK